MERPGTRASLATVGVGVVTRRSWIALATGAALVLVPGPKANAAPRAGIAFDDRAPGRLVLTAPGYTLTLAKRNGRILGLVDRAAGRSLVGTASRCLWGALAQSETSYVGGCSFARGSPRSFTYRWGPATDTLTLAYRGSTRGSSVVTLHAAATSFDLRLALANRGRLLTRVRFPDGLAGDTRTVTAGYTPNVLPGVRLAPGFFTRISNDVQIYPSRWAFADYLAYDADRAHLALYSVVPGPLRPVELGFAHLAAPSLCSGSSFCVVHEFQTWIRRGTTWTSPVVRVRIGETAQQSILAYRHDNGVDAYPSLSSKLGSRLMTFARAPLIKADLTRLTPFRNWAGELARLPSPAILHPVAFQPGGHDRGDPDFLPADPVVAGSDADFAAMIAAAHAHGDLVMPYGNLSWWDPASPTMQSARAADVAVLDEHGLPETIDYGSGVGVIVSPYAPRVRTRIAAYMDEWRTKVPADCLFLDQVGARPWLRDFNRASPSPLAYDDGWLDVIGSYNDRCLMVEDGWDRLARDAVGFHGSLLMMSREVNLPNQLFGEGNWEPYPLATWLLHDKVLLYEHDLYDGTMAVDSEVLAWNMAFGLVSSYSWDALGPGENPWLDLVALLQRDLGPHYAGVPLAAYRDLAPGVVESTFGDLDVVASLGAASTYPVDGSGVAPHGFLARTRDGSLVAGALSGTFDGVALSPGTHDVVVERTPASVTVRQPVGPDTELGVAPPAAWSPGLGLRATALSADGTELGTVAGRLESGRFVFPYAGERDGLRVAGYRVAVAS
jgi:hypothetical protein